VPCWVVICPNCRRLFPYAEIDQTTIQEANLDPYRILPRPPGEDRRCPHCNTESPFATTDLFYRA
jgi:hypothetical protein